MSACDTSWDKQLCPDGGLVFSLGCTSQHLGASQAPWPGELKSCGQGPGTTPSNPLPLRMPAGALGPPRWVWSRTSSTDIERELVRNASSVPPHSHTDSPVEALGTGHRQPSFNKPPRGPMWLKFGDRCPRVLGLP